MKKSTPVRIDEELYTAASQAASAMSRSTTQQLTHWARIGRELEASPDVSLEEVAAILRGRREYDAAGAREQAIVRSYWAERMAALRGALRLDREFDAEGRPYVELDEEGNVVLRGADAPATPGAG
ncbi:MAG: TA system antitoxin ParD family protein [Thermoanaerobaculia bacterium]